MLTVVASKKAVQSLLQSCLMEIRDPDVRVRKMCAVQASSGRKCNIRSDGSVSIRRLSQSYISNNNLVNISWRFSPRSDRDQGFLNARVMSWMTSRVKLSDDIDHASSMSRMMSQQILSDDVSHASTLSL